MIIHLEKIINLLGTKVSDETKLSFEMNVASIVHQLEEELNQAQLLLSAVITAAYISPLETNKIKKICSEMLNSYYSFGQRIDNACNTELKAKGIKINASFHYKDQDLRKARGASAHIREPLFSFKQSDDTVFGCTANTNYNPYQGECYDIEIEFKENDGTVCYRTTFEDLIKNIKASVIYTLDMLFNRLDSVL